MKLALRGFGQFLWHRRQFCLLPFKYQDSLLQLISRLHFKKLRKSEKRKGKLVFEQGIFEASGFENCYDLKDKHNLVLISFVLCSESFRGRNATVQFRLAAYFDYFLSKTFFFELPFLIDRGDRIGFKSRN